MNFDELINRIKNLDFEDVFPLYGRNNDTRNLLISSGIYLGIIVVAILLMALLGWIFILGVIIKIIAFVAIAYGVVGMVAGLLRFMKYN